MPHFHHLGFWPLLGVSAVRLIMLVLLVTVVVLLIRIINRRFPGGPATSTTSNSAEHVLAERFARGEIDAEEYETRRRILRNTRPEQSAAGRCRVRTRPRRPRPGGSGK